MPITDTYTRLDVHIRWMIRRDMEQVLEIEKSAFEFPSSASVRSMRPPTGFE